MKIGTKSLLFGAHQFLLHPLFLTIAWWKLYGFSIDIRLYVAFLIHDIGYWGKGDMDGIEGESHPKVGARIMGRLFGPKWEEFTLLHSRFYARTKGKPVSKLCIADKYVVCITPAWIYVPLVRATGEIKLYRTLSHDRDPEWYEMAQGAKNDWEWYYRLQQHMQIVVQRKGAIDASATESRTN